jgi:hypothetical protein
MSKQKAAEGFLRSDLEREAADQYARAFEQSPDSTADKLAHVARYMRRQDLTRMLVRYEIFKRILNVKGSIIECGVYRGAGLMCWANFSAVLEPANLTRRIYGFDTFAGFPAIGAEDHSSFRTGSKGELRADSYDELQTLIEAYDKNRFLGHIPRVELVPGDANTTIPEFLDRNPHLVAALLFLDFDLYEPTRTALDHFLPRMPKGAIVAFDELDYAAWPGETRAALDAVGLRSLRLERLPFDPYVGFAVLD